MKNDACIYVCYPIIKRIDEDIIKMLVQYDDMESFTTAEKATRFMTTGGRYGKYLMAVEKCDKKLWNEIAKGEE